MKSIRRRDFLRAAVAAAARFSAGIALIKIGAGCIRADLPSYTIEFSRQARLSDVLPDIGWRLDRYEGWETAKKTDGAIAIPRFAAADLMDPGGSVYPTFTRNGEIFDAWRPFEVLLPAGTMIVIDWADYVPTANVEHAQWLKRVKALRG